MGEDADRCLQGRVRHINVWRWISQEMHHDPLAVVDWQTTSYRRDDLLPLQDSNGATSERLVRHDSNHGWYYLGHQVSSTIRRSLYTSSIACGPQKTWEVTLIKCSDSHPGGAGTIKSPIAGTGDGKRGGEAMETWDGAPGSNAYTGAAFCAHSAFRDPRCVNVPRRIRITIDVDVLACNYI